MDQQLTMVADEARAALNGIGETHGTIAGAEPGLELFHAANSICSQKVRTVLAHHGLPYVSRSLNIFLGQTYLPGYVRLRMLGCARFGGALVSRHSGSTATAAGGCDGAVVPTLIDWDAAVVIVDSKRICLYLDDGMPAAHKLRPARLAAAIDADLAIVDNLPNYQMLMGRTVGADEAGSSRDGVGASFSQRKVAICDAYLEQYADDAVLVAAYTAKRTKELSAARELFSPEAMRGAYEHVETTLVELERRLARCATPWLYGEDVTMSDLFWGIELLRIKNVGGADFWRDGRLPNVARYAAATELLPSIREAVLDWPGAIY